MNKNSAITKRQEKAVFSFDSGCNCAQAVLTSFADLLKMDEEALKRISAGFGGGMGKLQLTCGAVTGAYMTFGLYTGQISSNNFENKDRSAIMVREFHRRFVASKSTSSCRDLIGVDLNTKEGQAEAAEKELYKSVCSSCVELAVGIAEDLIKEGEHGWMDNGWGGEWWED